MTTKPGTYRVHRGASFLLITSLIAALATTATAQKGPDEAGLAQTIQNPLANLVSFPVQTNWNVNTGPAERVFFNMNIQPVVPFTGEKWNIISRTIIPVNGVPVGETDSVFGVGDTTLTLFASPAETGSLIWGVGPIFGLPTASNQEALGSGKFSIGPSVVLMAQPGPWSIGVVGSNLWSFAGDGDREDVNFFAMQYFANFNFGKGWAVGTAPIVTANWKADSGQQWTVPWGAQISKLTNFGQRPVNMLIGYYHNATRPDGAAEGQVRFQVNFLFPG